MRAAGMLLTGGASRRMGTDKADLVLSPGGESLARRTARLLAAVTRLAIEVGPGHTDLPCAADEHPGAGPLAAVATGRKLLDDMGGCGPVVVLATDMPFLTPGFLDWLAGHPGDRSVVPVMSNRPQPLCARYTWPDLGRVGALVGSGRASMRDLLSVIDALMVGEEEWAPAARDRRALLDVDTREDLEMARRTPR